MQDNRLVIVTGHYGSGKTEFSMNYVLKLKEQYDNVCIADLDIVNPYFRSREKKEMLESKGITVCDSSIKNTAIDLPAIPAEVMGVIQDNSKRVVLDVGGDPVGARVLARFSKLIQSVGYDLFCVVNANRPETQTAEHAIDYIRKIEEVADLKVTGIINNTHLLKSTTTEDVERGHELAVAVSKETGIPIKYEAAINSVADQILNKEIKEKVFPINMYMREEWMS